LLRGLGLLAGLPLLSTCGYPPAPDASAPVTLGRKGGTHLQIWWSGGSKNPAVDQAVAAYATAHPTWSADVSYTNGWDKLLVAVAAGTPPDVVIDAATTLIKGAARQTFAQLDAYLARDRVDPAQYYQAARIAMRYQQATYGMPEHLVLASLYQNDLVLNELGLDPTHAPTSWEDLALLNEQSLKMVTKGRTRAGFVPTWGWPADSAGWLQANGVPLLNAEGTKVAFATPAGVEALDWVARQLQVVGGVDWISAYRKPYVAGPGEALAVDQLAMGLMDVGEIPSTILAITPNFTLHQWPVPGGPSAVGQTFGYFDATLLLLPAAARQQEAAWDYIKFHSGPAGQAFVQPGSAGAAIACIPAVANNLGADEALKWRGRTNELVALAHTPAFLQSPASAAVQAAMQQAAEPLWSGAQDAPTTMAVMQRAAQAVLDTSTL